MGWVVKRLRDDKTTAYMAMYRDARGNDTSAGTYDTEKEATAAWHREEDRIASGRKGDPRRGKQPFKDYVETWRMHYFMEDTTGDDADYRIPKYLTKWFGKMPMKSILPTDVREWQTWMQEKHATKPATLRRIRNTLSAIFTTALNDGVIDIHPCKGVKLPPIPQQPITVITPEQFDDIYDELPNAFWQLFVETDIETGLRWGEMIELRPKDWDPATRTFTIRRVAVEVRPHSHPSGGRFRVKEYPKNRKPRRTKVSNDLAQRINDHIATKELDPDDLLFEFTQPQQSTSRTIDIPDPDTLGLTDPNHKGRRYKHGTMSGYNAGKCRCKYCKAACAKYRAARRSSGKDSPRNLRTVNTDGHIPNDWFRNNIWNPTLEPAKVGFHVRPHDLRHAHASWLLAGGADIQVVKEQLGHASLVTTEKYLHTLPDNDERAVDALATTRNRNKKAAESSDDQLADVPDQQGDVDRGSTPEPVKTNDLLEQMARQQEQMLKTQAQLTELMERAN